jgi:hypothetical protein
MGIVHKLKPEVLSFIIENKKNNPSLSCRNLTSLILEQLHIEVSKSSINAIFKENNLSMPIGRRRKPKKRKFNMPVLPVIEDAKIARLGDLSQKIAQDQDKEKIFEEKAAQDLARIKALEEAKLRDLERVAQEEAENKRKQEEAEKLEEARLRDLERIAQEEAENKRKQEEAKKLEEEKAALEIARIKALEEAKLRDLEKLVQEAAENKRKQEEAKKLEEEKVAQDVARIKALEEAKLRDLEKLVQEAAENKRKQEEAHKLELEKAAQEIARIKAFEEARLRDLERIAQEEAENKRKQEEAKKLEEEKVAQDLARIKALEEAKLRDLERIAQDEAEYKHKQEESRKSDKEKVVQEAELRAEREKWARLAEEEQKAKQQVNKPKEEVTPPEVESVAPEILPEERVCSGAIILKALDYLIGGSREINAAISQASGVKPEDSLNLTEVLIFKSLFNKDNFSTLGDLIGVRYSQGKLNSYYAQVKQLTDIGSDVAKIISNVFTEAKGVKIHFIDGSDINLDGQLHSSWPATRFPYDFSNTLMDLKNNLNKHFLQGAPLVLFSPPGYDILPKDFFNLLLNMGSKNNYPESLTLFGNQLEELDKISLTPENRCSLIFGLWPWQFTSSRKVKKIGEFNLKHIKEIERDLYLGEIEIDLFRASLNQSITLRGCAVKTDLKEKIRLVILNTDERVIELDELAGIYLSRWPNFEEAFQDFSRKIELFTYAGNDQKFFSKDTFGMDTAGLTMELSAIFANYIKMLDAYLRWHFLPAEYTEKDLSSTSECFYKIPVKLIASQSRVRARTLVSQNYQFLKDLEYLNCRLNERQIKTANGKMFWFESAFK